MTITALFLVVIALMLGAIAGWMVGSARKSAEAQRARSERDRVIVERDSAKQERERSEKLRAEMQQRLEEAQQARAVAESHFSNLQKVEDTFTALAQKAFKNVSESLVSANKTQVGGTLDSMLMPVREMLDAYRGEVQKSEQERAIGYGGLQEQIRTLLATQEQASREAARLANALQSPTVQGSWGEMSLKRCIELAGMSEYCRELESGEDRGEREADARRGSRSVQSFREGHGSPPRRRRAPRQNGREVQRDHSFDRLAPLAERRRAAAARGRRQRDGFARTNRSRAARVIEAAAHDAERRAGCRRSDQSRKLVERRPPSAAETEAVRGGCRWAPAGGGGRRPWGRRRT